MNRKLIFILVFYVAFVSAASFCYANDTTVVSSKYSIKYHLPTCKQARKIQPQVKITFGTAKKALETGRIPCNVCKPPGRP
jgi:hypothetical protein